MTARYHSDCYVLRLIPVIGLPWLVEAHLLFDLVELANARVLLTYRVAS